MAIGVIAGVDHLPRAERPGYADPYPEGLAVSHADLVGDASGGSASVTVLADGGFLYRVEAVSIIVGDTSSNVGNLITMHRNLSDPSGEAGLSQLNWILETKTFGSQFSVLTPGLIDYQMLRRFPLGRTDRVDLQTLAQLENSPNTNTVTYEFTIVLSYWRVTGSTRPGFLQAFWEAPTVPQVR